MELKNSRRQLLSASYVSTILTTADFRPARELASRAPESWRPFVIDAFEREMRSSPVGRLHLERIEMFPAGIERGELTVPMAPKETITISHKEWSTSGEEYEKIVQDSFESYSERGVAEKTDFSMSSENETKHGIQRLPVGGNGPVNVQWGETRVRLEPQFKLPGERTGGSYLHVSKKGHTSGCVEARRNDTGLLFFAALVSYALSDRAKRRPNLVIQVIYRDKLTSTRGRTEEP